MEGCSKLLKKRLKAPNHSLKVLDFGSKTQVIIGNRVRPMEQFVEFRAVNESARIDWLNEDGSAFRLTYRNRFWGSCRLAGKLLRRSDGVHLDRTSISIEDIACNRGAPALLPKIATDFLIKKIQSDPDLWRTNHSPESEWTKKRRLRWQTIAERVRKLALSS